jgi:hypothetical protein
MVMSEKYYLCFASDYTLLFFLGEQNRKCWRGNGGKGSELAWTCV